MKWNEMKRRARNVCFRIQSEDFVVVVELDHSVNVLSGKVPKKESTVLFVWLLLSKKTQ